MFIFWFMWVPARRWPTAESAGGAGRLPLTPVCESDHRCAESTHKCADRTTSVTIPHAPRTVQGEILWCYPFTLGQRKVMGNQPLGHRDRRVWRTEMGPHAAGHVSCLLPISCTTAPNPLGPRRADGSRLWRPLLCDASVTMQCTVWGFFTRCRIRDRGFSPRPGRKGSNWFPARLLSDPFAAFFLGSPGK